MDDFTSPMPPDPFGSLSPSPQQQPASSRRYRRAQGGPVVSLMLLACIGLGGALAWGVREHRERARLSARNHAVENAYTVVLARRNDIAAFLTDPRTRLHRLSGRGLASGRMLTIAWQEQTRSGLVVGERVPVSPDGMIYTLWCRGSGTGKVAMQAGTFRAEAGLTCQGFFVPAVADGDGVNRFEVTLAPAGARGTTGGGDAGAGTSARVTSTAAVAATAAAEGVAAGEVVYAP